MCTSLHFIYLAISERTGQKQCLVIHPAMLTVEITVQPVQLNLFNLLFLLKRKSNNSTKHSNVGEYV